MIPVRFELRLPDWLAERLATVDRPFRTASERMRLAIELASGNVERRTGGPFGAAVFERSSGRLVAAGVNCVVASGLSVAHAEILALSLAQLACGSFDLSSSDLELATSAEPCEMCLGAVHWSGIRSILCGARDADVRGVGFDEGAKPADWVARWSRRGVSVELDVERFGAVEVLERYRREGGAIYNAGLGEP